MKRNIRLVSILPAFLVLSCATGSAQLISVGVLGGVPILSPAARSDSSPRYTVGPSVEVKLPAGFAIEADALYQPIRSNAGPSFAFSAGSAGDLLGYSFANHQRGNSWEFPLLGKYYFHRVAGGQPFAGAGFSFRTIGIESSGYSVTGTGAAPVYTPFDSHYRAELAVGAVAAAGLRYKVGRFSVVPQIRYTRWGIGDSLSRKNAFGAFLGVTF